MDEIPIYVITGWVLLLGGGAVIALLVAQQLGFLRQQKAVHEHEISRLREEIGIVREERERRKALPAAWNGTRKFRVDQKIPEAGGICSFYLKPHDNKTPLPPFLPGQFLTFALEIKGKEVVRCYSLSDCHRPDHYRVSIKRVLAPRDKPGIPPGLVSFHFHDHINEGDILDVRAPSGGFALDPQGTGGVVLNGSGVGLTPVLAMMNHLMESGSRRDIWFFYGVGNGDENMIKDKIKEWRSAGRPNAHVHVAYSRPNDDEEAGKDYDHKGRVDIELLKNVLPSNNFDFYTCGPGPMMDAIREGLGGWGVPEAHIHDEAFMQVKESVSIEAATVEWKRSGSISNIAGEVTSLLDFADSENIRIPSGCRTGGCGTCQTALISGKVKYPKPPEFKIEDGCCLPCVCLPDGNIVVDA
ncbi:2Fe-2S iron-sulfur cluster-binding protein [soil metagenome]